MSCRDCDRALEDQGSRLKRAEDERRRLTLAMESIAEALGVDAGRLTEDPWAVTESALQAAVAAEREACAKLLEARAKEYFARRDDAESPYAASSFNLGANTLMEGAGLLRARGKEPTKCA